MQNCGVVSGHKSQAKSAETILAPCECQTVVAEYRTGINTPTCDVSIRKKVLDVPYSYHMFVSHAAIKNSFLSLEEYPGSSQESLRCL